MFLTDGVLLFMYPRYKYREAVMLPGLRSQAQCVFPVHSGQK